MNNLLEDTDDEELPLRRVHHAQDREITLGTTMILLIFFALAVYGAALFGFGYSLGSKHTGDSASVASASPGGSFGGSKPSPASPIGSTASSKIPIVDTPPVPYTVPAPVKTAPPPTASTADPSSADDPKPKPSPPAAASTPPPNPTGGPPIGPPIVVQVAAVSHQEDADLIASTLQKRGYAVTVRTEADKLFHVQVGPFYTRKDADAMKARLLADGFNAYIK